MSDKKPEVSSLAMPRETGVERSGASCDNCQAELPVVTSLYGSTTVGACPSCTAPAQLEAQKAAAVSEPDEESS